MAYKVKIGQFAKNIESTAQPDTTLWPEYDVVFKNGADISNPQITISATYANVQNANYAYMLGRYYWITAKNLFRENYIILQLKVDVLATYKTEIGSSNLYILRSSTAYDGTIKDNLYPLKAEVTAYSDWDTLPGYTYDTGVYVLNVAGNYTSGNSSLYQLDPPNFRKLLQELYDTIGTWSLDSVVNKVVNFFGGNPQKLIHSAMWFPTEFTAGAWQAVYIGSWGSTTALGKLISNPEMVLPTFTPDILKHPQATARGSYLNLAPYSEYNLVLPGAGIINLDTTQLIGCSSISIVRTVDAFTGRMLYRVVNDPTDPTQESHTLAEVTTQWGVPLTLGSKNTATEVVSGVINTVGAAVLAPTSAGAMIGALSGAIGTIDAAISGQSCNSGVGGALNMLNHPMRLDGTFFNIADEDNARKGRPYCKVTTPATLGGFMIADRGDVQMSGPLPEHEEVKRYLETGFFYE